MPTIKTLDEILEELPATRVVIENVCFNTHPPAWSNKLRQALELCVNSGYALGWADRAQEDDGALASIARSYGLEPEHLTGPTDAQERLSDED